MKFFLNYFILWCREKGAVTIADAHTLTGKVKEAMEGGSAIKGYKLLEPLLPALDIFFCSLDEAKMIARSIGYWARLSESEIADSNQFPIRFLNSLTYRINLKEGRTRLFGMTYSRGAFYVGIRADGTFTHTKPVESRYLWGETVDLVGAGDAFRAGLLTYISNNLERFKDGSINFEEAVQMGNLFASLLIKAPLNCRYDFITKYEPMLKVVQSGMHYKTLAKLTVTLTSPSNLSRQH